MGLKMARLKPTLEPEPEASPMEDRLTEAAQQLSGFGFTLKEAIVYLHLLIKNGCKASELADRIEMQRTAVYEILNELQRRAIVKRTLERPFRYYASPIKGIIEAHLEEHSRRLRDKQAAKSNLLSKLEVLPIEEPSATEFFQVVQDRDIIYKKIRELVGVAEREVLVALNQPLAVIVRYDLDTVFKSGSKRGVKVKLLTTLHHSEVAILKKLAAACEIRHTPLHCSDFFIIDKHVIMILRNNTATPFKETALWIDSDRFRETIAALFDEFWSRSIEATRYVHSLKNNREHNEVFSCLNYESIKPYAIRMYSSAKEEISLIGLSEGPFWHAAERECEEIVRQKALKEKIRVRALGHLNKSSYPELVELLKFAEVRVTDFPARAIFDVVDQNEVLIQDVPRQDEAGAYLATWIRSSSIASSFRFFFNYIWENSTPFNEGMKPT